MSRERLNPFRLNDLAGTGPNRTATLERLLQEERQALQTTRDGEWDHHIATANVTLLEGQIETSKRNDEARREIDAEIDERRQAEATAAEQRRQAKADIEAGEVRTAYKASNPTATDAEVDAVLPGLIERRRQDRAEQLLAQARSQYRI